LLFFRRTLELSISHRLRQLQRRSNATQKQAINAFKYGLREDLALWIISENPSSLDEAIESAKLLEQASITLRKKNEDLEADRPKVNALDQQSNDNRRFQSKPVLSCYSNQLEEEDLELHKEVVEATVVVAATQIKKISPAHGSEPLPGHVLVHWA